MVKLHELVRKGDVEAVKALLLENKLELNGVDKTGNTPLHVAVVAGNEPLVRVLLENGASMSLKDGDGRTPLQLAVYHDQDHLVSLLVARSDPIRKSFDA